MMLFVKLIKGNKLITFVLDYQSWSLFTLTDIFPVSFQAARERESEKMGDGGGRILKCEEVLNCLNNVISKI